MRDIVAHHVFRQIDGYTWKEAPEMPTATEITMEQMARQDIPTNDVFRPWDDKDRYLETLYKILRCEGTKGLRYSVCSVLRAPNMADDKNTCIYTNVGTQTG